MIECVNVFYLSDDDDDDNSKFLVLLIFIFSFFQYITCLYVDIP